MQYFTVKNWRRFQHYRDRNPPWIKLHFEILSSQDWVMLDDASRVLAIACMLIASRNSGQVPNNPDYLSRVAYLQKVDFKPLIDCGFLEDASGCYHLQANARPETETETDILPTLLPYKIGSSREEEDLPLNKADHSKSPRCPFENIRTLFHETLPDLPRCLELTATRRGDMRARWQEACRDNGGPKGAMGYFQEYFARVGASGFLMGRKSSANGRKPFRATLPWLMKAENHAKVLEGNYDG